MKESQWTVFLNSWIYLCLMAFLNPFCSWTIFLLITVTHGQTPVEDCSVTNNEVEIEENNPLGLVVANISTAPGFTVTITPPSTADSHTDWFEIKDSQLILNKSVDYETTTVLFLELTCWKGSLAVNSLLVTVKIKDVNDNPPVFEKSKITVEVLEDTKVNTTVIPPETLTATDADIDDVMFYSLEGNPPEAMDYFDIQGINNPQMYVRKDLNYEAINVMNFTLTAMDGNASAPGTHNATMTITIWIRQADRRPPWFQPCIGGRIVCISLGYSSKVNLSENVTRPLTLEPGPLYAIDGDKSLNEKVVYEIAAGNDDNTFSINRDSGSLTMNQTANTLKTFVLYIVASQENNPYRYSQTTVEIEVVRKNDHQPYFVKTIYAGKVSVNQPVNSLVMEANAPSVALQIFAADDDFPDNINPDIKYSIQNSSDFKVTTEGFLQTTVVLNMVSTITVLAIANDTKALQEASTLITVDVTSLATTTVPPVATTTTTTSPASPGKGTTSSKPSALPPGISSSQPSVSSESTKSMSPSSSTTGNADITKITENPVTITGPGSAFPPVVTPPKPPVITGDSSQSLTTGSPITGRSQLTMGSDKSTVQASPQSGTTKPSITGTFVTTGGGTIPSLTSSQSEITNPPIASVSPATDGSRQSTTWTPQTGTTNPSLSGTTMTTGGTVNSSLTFQTATSKPSIPGSIPASPISKTTISVTSATTSSKISKPSTPRTATPSSNNSYKTTGTGILPTSSITITGSEDPFESCSVDSMAALGATLGSLLAIALALLALISYKYYKLKQKLGKGSLTFTEGFSNATFQDDGKLNSNGKDDQLPASIAAKNYEQEKALESHQALTDSETIKEVETGDTDSEKEVRSILTKDRRMEDDGYKAVWFKDDIVPEATDDILLIEGGSDIEQNGIGSDSDNAEDDSDNNDTDSGRGGSEVSAFPGRAQLFRTNPSASQHLGEAEEHEHYL